MTMKTHCLSAPRHQWFYPNIVSSVLGRRLLENELKTKIHSKKLFRPMPLAGLSQEETTCTSSCFLSRLKSFM
jgi:hypothetical protein